MHWLADECIAAPLVTRMRAAGHDVRYMAEHAPSATDSDVIRRAQSEKRLLLTEDKDFGELAIRRRWPVPGIVLLRTGSDRTEFNWQRLNAAVTQYNDGLWGRLTIVEDARLRSRPLQTAGQNSERSPD